MKRLSKMQTLLVLPGLITLIVLSAVAWQNEAMAAPKFAYYPYYTEPILDWDPSVEFSAGTIVLNNIYETLLRYDPARSRFIPILATDYTASDDGMRWTFKIRKGVKFHDGSAVNAQAVKYSIERTMKLGKGAAYIWDPVDKIVVLDDHTVRFDLKYPAPIDLISSCTYSAFIVSPTSVKANADDWLSKGNEAGSGPYQIKRFKMGDEVVLSAFKDYWQGWKANQFEIVVIKRVSETTSRRQLIEKGDADITFALPAEDIEALKTSSNVQVTVSQSFQNMFLFFNTVKKPLDNKLVRQALSYAFPYDDVVKYAFGGYATKSRGPIPVGLWGHGKELKQYSYDLNKARQFLAQAGYPDGGLKLLLTYLSGDESEKKTVELFKSELAKLNVDLEIRGMPWGSQWEVAKNNKAETRQDIFLMYWWPDYISPYSWLYPLFRSQKETLFNVSYYASENFDKAIDEANATSSVDREKATRMFVDAQKTIIEDAPAIFALDTQTVWVTNKSFKGFRYNPCYSQVVFFYDTYRE